MQRRALGTLGVTALMITTLSACGSGPEKLDQEGTASALLSEEEFPLDGFTRGEVSEGVEESEPTEDLSATLGGLGDISQECETALTDLSDLQASDYLDAQSTADFTKEDQQVSLMVGGATEDPQPMLDAFTGVADSCDDVEVEEQGVSLTLTFDELDAEDLEGSSISMEAAGQTLEMTMGGRVEGDNVVFLMTQGVAADEAAEVASTQAEQITE